MTGNEEEARRVAAPGNQNYGTERETSAWKQYLRHPWVLMGAAILETYKLLAGGGARLALVHLRGAAPAQTDGEEEGRRGDRRLKPEDDSPARRRWGTALLVLTYLIAVAGGVGFLYFYWNGSGNAELGVTLAAFLGGMGCSSVLSARWLMLRRQATGVREPLRSPTEEREAARTDFSEGAGEIRRRGLLGGIAVTGAAFVGAIVVSLFRSLGTSPQASLFDTVWKPGQRLTKSDGSPVTLDALEPGSTMIVFPEDRIGDERAQTVLIRVDSRLLDLPRGREKWAPNGYLAYSRVCTHAGCPVGVYETTTAQLMCPCHQSTFDVLRGARPTGGPAARPLPQLPLHADADGFLRATEGFTEPPGPGFWGLV